MALLQYPFCKDVWMVLIPLCIERVGFGLVEGCVGPVLNYLAYQKDEAMVGALNGLFNAAINVGVTFGRLIIPLASLLNIILGRHG